MQKERAKGSGQLGHQRAEWERTVSVDYRRGLTIQTLGNVSCTGAVSVDKVKSVRFSEFMVVNRKEGWGSPTHVINLHPGEGISKERPGTLYPKAQSSEPCTLKSLAVALLLPIFLA